MASITIYHNPACGTSRNTLALIRNSGAELCRPGELVLGILPNGQQGAFTNQDGGAVFNAKDNVSDGEPNLSGSGAREMLLS